MGRFPLIAALSVIFAGCAAGLHAKQAGENPSEVRLYLPAVQFGPSDSLVFSWQKGDSVFVKPVDETEGIYYHLSYGEGSSTAVFDGPSLEEGRVYEFLYEGYAPEDVFTGEASAYPEGGIYCRLQHSAAFLKARFSIPREEKLTAFVLQPLVGPDPLADLQLDSLRGDYTHTAVLAPGYSQGMTALLLCGGGNLYTARLGETEFRAGEGVRLDIDPVLYDYNIPDSEIRVLWSRQERIDVAAGQYSGIARVDENTYAVVHDKSKGGGLHSFTIEIDGSGSLLSVAGAEFEANGGLAAGKDNEDVVYVPSRGTLFVSAEGDQSIREYGLDGVPTGVSLEIPADLGKSFIKSNAGFESLAYDATNGYFWTTTESPLKEEALGESMYRIQRFSDKSLAPDARYLYLAGSPIVPESKAAAANAYVCGVSAMTALEDGRLVVLEREVYVPNGSVLEKALGSFTRISLFVTDPLHDTSGILSKKLLTRFYTQALNLANFEGMTLGPVLPDGSRTLLLIADSQGGKGGLTGEYLYIISIR